MANTANWPTLLLAGAVFGLLLNILILPMLPTHDGAWHTYYAQVFVHLLAGDSTYSHSFAIRSVFPPYACHFYLLVGLNHFFNPYLTERIIACLVILWTFAGFARLSKALGKNGIWGCFFVLPFLANWHKFRSRNGNLALCRRLLARPSHHRLQRDTPYLFSFSLFSWVLN